MLSGQIARAFSRIPKTIGMGPITVVRQRHPGLHDERSAKPSLEEEEESGSGACDSNDEEEDDAEKAC